MSVPAVEFKNVSRIYERCRANDHLSFSITQGSIHGLIGENGAGKSTAMKMLFGLEQPDEGEIFVFGQKVQFSSATEAMNSGIAMVHQHFMLAENLTALENFMLVQSSSSPWQLRNKRSELALAEEFARSYHFTIPWLKPINELSIGEQQRLEILKALSRRGKILILDEPTAVLTPHEIQEFFKKLRALKSQGQTLILITHKLKEVLEITDEVTILRQGKVVDRLQTAQANASILSEKMIGHRLETLQVTSAEMTSAKDKTKKLRLKNIKAETASARLEVPLLEITGGEILGIAGVEGNGQQELIDLLLHPKSFKKIEGELELLGQSTLGLSTSRLRQLSLGVLPEDRLHRGSVSTMNLTENFLLGYQHQMKWGFISWAELEKETNKNIQKFNVVPADPLARFSSLSGGNQQKLVAARELSHNPELIFAFQPTRGVDIGAADFIHRQILAAKNRQAAVLLISSELDELLKLSDRILVFFRGRVQAEFSRSSFNENKIGAAMGGFEVSP